MSQLSVLISSSLGTDTDNSPVLTLHGIQQESVQLSVHRFLMCPRIHFLCLAVASGR